MICSNFIQVTCKIVQFQNFSLLFIFCQTPGYIFSLGVDFVLPQSQQQEPQPKSIKRGCTRSLKFRLGVQRTHITRRTRKTKRTPPKSTIREHTKNLIMVHIMHFLPISDLKTKRPNFLNKFCFTKNFFWLKTFFEPKISSNSQFFGSKFFKLSMRKRAKVLL